MKAAANYLVLAAWAALAAAGCSAGMAGATVSAESMRLLAAAPDDAGGADSYYADIEVADPDTDLVAADADNTDAAEAFAIEAAADERDRATVLLAADDASEAFVVSDDSDPVAAFASDDPTAQPAPPTLSADVTTPLEETTSPDVAVPDVAQSAPADAYPPGEDEERYEAPPGAPHVEDTSVPPAAIAHEPPAEPRDDMPTPRPVEFFAEVPGVERLAQVEEIDAPRAVPRDEYSLSDDENRLDRSVLDVRMDIRTRGEPGDRENPPDYATQWLADEPTVNETFPSGVPAEVFCRYTPWTICYRPLYFEDIKLERYGCNVGYLQSGLSGVRFFSSIAALPYKMTRRPPRTCQCSNGFSRCGDCPLPGYGNRRFQWDAALIETAIVTGFVFILP